MSLRRPSVHPTWASIVVLALSTGSGEAGASTNSTCAQPLQSQDGGGSFSLGYNSGVLQPIGLPGTVARCSLATESAYTSTTLSLVAWDPVTLMADPTTVALRTRAFTYSECLTGGNTMNLVPPLVTRKMAGLADPPRPTVALDYRNTFSFGVAQTIHWNPAGAAIIPTAYSYYVGGPVTPFGGDHPVIAHELCSDDGTDEELLVMQCIMTTTAALDTASYDWAQGFRVPQRTFAKWIELALAPGPVRGDPGLLHLTLVDALGGANPSSGVPLASSSGYFYSFSYGFTPSWVPLAPFAETVTLEPGHDYWLVVRTDHDYTTLARVLTGTESTDFLYSIGPLLRRDAPWESWQPIADRRASFRLIGGTDVVLAVGDPPSPSLRLTAAPKPARGDVTLGWSGATGPVRLEVLDVRGRRVARRDGDGASGQWSWRASAGGGRVGTYFARITDAAGRVAVERVVMVR